MDSHALVERVACALQKDRPEFKPPLGYVALGQCHNLSELFFSPIKDKRNIYFKCLKSAFWLLGSV